MSLTREGGSAIAIALVATETLIKEGQHFFLELKEEKTYQEIKKINEILKECIASCNNKTTSLPAIFTFDDPNNPKKASSIQFNKEILADLESPKSKSDIDPNLLGYVQYIKNCMAHIYRFYLVHAGRSWPHHPSPQDTTSSVLNYLLLILHTHCLKFEGYDIDIAIIKILEKFINKFSFLHGENSDRCRLLTPAFNCLTAAQKELEEHSKTFFYQDYLRRLASACNHTNDHLIKLITTIITPNKYWESELTTITVEEISRGLIKPAYSSIFNRAIELHDNHLTKITKKCAKHFCDVTFKHSSEHDLGKEDEQKHSANDGNPFQGCNNFLTYKAKQIKSHDASNKLVNIDKTELPERIKIFENFILLSNLISHVQSFSSYLHYSFKELGEAYISNPHHCNFVFDVLNGLSEKIAILIKTLFDVLQDLDIQISGTMSPPQQQDLLPEIRTLLTSIEQEVVGTINIMVSKHRERNKNALTTEQVIYLEESKMLSAANSIAKKFNIKTEHSVIECKYHQLKQSPLPSEAKSRSLSTPPSLTTSGIFSGASIQREEKATLKEPLLPAAKNHNRCCTIL